MTWAEDALDYTLLDADTYERFVDTLESVRFNIAALSRRQSRGDRHRAPAEHLSKVETPGSPQRFAKVRRVRVAVFGGAPGTLRMRVESSVRVALSIPFPALRTIAYLRGGDRPLAPPGASAGPAEPPSPSGHGSGKQTRPVEYGRPTTSRSEFKNALDPRDSAPSTVAALLARQGFLWSRGRRHYAWCFRATRRRWPPRRRHRRSGGTRALSWFSERSPDALVEKVCTWFSARTERTSVHSSRTGVRPHEVSVMPNTLAAMSV